MPNQWFRMYNEFAHDPKVQMMSEAMQRRLIMLFCDRSCDVTVTLSEQEIAFRWRISDDELAQTKALFISKGFIDEEWNVLNWDRRQFVSDSSTDRTRRYRERKRTSQERHNVTEVTKCDALDTDTDTEQIQNREDLKPIASSDKPLSAEPTVFSLPVIGGEYHVTQKLYDKLVSAYPGVSVMAELAKMDAWSTANPKKKKTKSGIDRAINSWMDRAQNNASSRGGNNHAAGIKQTFNQQKQSAAIDALQEARTLLGLDHGATDQACSIVQRGRESAEITINRTSPQQIFGKVFN